MGGGVSGGNTTTIADGGAGLKKASSSVSSRSGGLDQAGGRSAGVGSDALAAALGRFSAATSQFAADLGTQLEAAGTLATAASADLDAATGGPS